MNFVVFNQGYPSFPVKQYKLVKAFEKSLIFYKSFKRIKIMIKINIVFYLIIIIPNNSASNKYPGQNHKQIKKYQITH